MVLSRLIASAILAAMLSSASAADEARSGLSALTRSIQNDLDLLESRVTTRPPREGLESDRLRGGVVDAIRPTPLRSAQDVSLSSDLGAARQDLRTLKTRKPNARATPILERQLDRVSREAGADLYRPSRNPAALYAR